MQGLQLFAIGNNINGQGGFSYSEEQILSPTELTHLDNDLIYKVATSQDQTYLIYRNGIINTAGENDNNQLCRSTLESKRSWLSRVDSLEIFQIVDAALSNTFITLLSNEGKLISWGANDMGQLGNGTRDSTTKPRVNSAITESIIQLSCGSHHVCALTKAGTVMTWGANKRGQIGDGQLTSTTMPYVVTSLKHRPVVSISCGENHTIVLTAEGNLYSWGDNSQGQLGLSDTTNRLRPEAIKTLRSVKTVKIATGGAHSMFVASNGLLFACGSNSHGQLGLQNAEIRTQTVPVVVDRLSELRTIDVTCGKAQTYVITAGSSSSSGSGKEDKSRKVFVMGLNSSGQLGLGHTANVLAPTVLPLSLTHNVLTVYCSCLSLHAFVLTGPAQTSRRILPSVDFDTVSESVNRYLSLQDQLVKATGLGSNNVPLLTKNTNLALQATREMIATAFSSISILNASFLSSSGSASGGGSSAGGSNSPSQRSADHLNLSINLQDVRNAYTLLLSTEAVTPLIVNTLGRATLLIAEQLRQCPFDDVENLSVFLIVLENPLMLRPADFHVAIETVVSSILSLPKYYRAQLFKILKSYPSEYLGRILLVLKKFLSFILTNFVSKLDPTAVVLVLETLHQCNEESDILPAAMFYNEQLSLHKGKSQGSVNMLEEWHKHKSAPANSKVFNFWDYSFLINDTTKHEIIQYDFAQSKINQVTKFVRRFMSPDMLFHPDSGQLLNPEQYPNIPSCISISATTSTIGADGTIRMGGLVVHANVKVERDTVVSDLLGTLQNMLTLEPDILRLPLRVMFQGEMGVDRGGVTKELITVALRSIVKETDVLCPTGNGYHLWFSHSTEGYEFPNGIELRRIQSAGDATRNDAPNTFSLQYYLGLIVGLAAYNGVFVDVPLPSFIYKILRGKELVLSDLWEVDPELAKGLQSLLDYQETGSIGGSVEEVFGAVFTASRNPLLANSRSSNSSSSSSSDGDKGVSDSASRPCDLIADGANTPVTKLNRTQFVRLFVHHALYGCCKREVDDYLAGLRFLFEGLAVNKCTHIELEQVLCGSRDVGDLSELRLHTTYKGDVFTDEHPVINWFWNVLSSLTLPYKRKFLQFVTGSERIPLGGLSNLGLVIQSTAQGDAYLPTSHTCFNILDLPVNYTSEEHLREKLLLALDNCEGFGLI